MHYYIKYSNQFFLIFLIAAVIALYFPVSFSDYLYTDEANQLWFSKKGINFQTSIPQGRYLTYRIFECVFNYINTVHKVIYARLFSLFGWIICLPIWFYITNKVAIKNNLSSGLTKLLMLYIITMPPFIIYIGWSACMEMYIACTCSLIGGFILYEGIKYKEKVLSINPFWIVVSIVFSLISLFTYQNCFGCFFIPFLIQFVSTKKFTYPIYIAFATAIITLILYFVIFKFSLIAYALPISDRSSYANNPLNKLIFLFSRPLATAFHFTYIFNENSIAGIVIYLVFLVVWFVLNFVIPRGKSVMDRFSYLVGLGFFLILIYLPSLVVKENFSSNRTLFALNIFIFIVVAETVFSLVKKDSYSNIIAVAVGVLFLSNAWYNYNIQFLNPLKIEYNLLQNIIRDRYQSGILAIYFINPPENAFETKFNITSSWDEFGIPSTAKLWVPEPLLKQLIFEKTSNRQIAEKIVIKNWISKKSFDQSAEVLVKPNLVIDMQKELSKY